MTTQSNSRANRSQPSNRNSATKKKTNNKGNNAFKQAKKASFKKRQLKKSEQSKSKPSTSEQIHTLAFNDKNYALARYPATDDQSLRAWSNTELLAINYLDEHHLLAKLDKIHLYNDRFGAWHCLLTNMTKGQNITSIITHASQQKAVKKNWALNSVHMDITFNDDFTTPLDDLHSVNLALIKMPKSVELFELFLQQIHRASNEKTQVICGFMTKYFASSMLKVAARYFADVEQSQAWKKARLLILKQPKQSVDYPTPINKISFNDKIYQQYFGVFSADKIDMGTQFLLEQFNNGQLMVKSKEHRILDLACGNGVIAGELVAQTNSQTELTLLDDFNLAIESAKINMQDFGLSNTVRFVCNDNLSSFADNSFDLVVSNPPFHFEHENNIEVALSLFSEVQKVLKTGGRFILVANKHLNYQTHLAEIFNKVFVVTNNRKFEIYECVC